jgi:hypothetical protein
VPKLTSIEGGGGRGIHSYAGERAIASFETLVIRIFRDVTREQSTFQLCELLFEFNAAVIECDVPLFEITKAAMANLRGRAFDANVPEYDQEVQDVLRFGIRVAAERMSDDSAARGRISQRSQDLETAIKWFIQGKEARTRENGWSYVENVTKSLGPWHPPQKVRIKPASSSRGHQSSQKHTDESKKGHGRLKASEKIDHQETSRRAAGTNFTSAAQGKDEAAPRLYGARPIPNYAGMKRYQASADELSAIGVKTIDELVERVNRQLIKAGNWPLSQGDFPRTRTQFKKVVRMLEQEGVIPAERG